MTFVRNPVLAFLGLLAVGLVAAKLWTGDLGVTQAAARVGVVTAGLVVAERFFLPLARSLVQSGQRER